MSRSDEDPYIFDQKLIPRIKSYLKDNTAESFTDPDVVAKFLQSRYRSDYGRRKKKAFIYSITKALEKARLEMFGKAAGNSPSKRQRKDSSSDSNPDTLVSYENTNAMNIAMRNLYKGSPVVKDGAATTEPNTVATPHSDHSRPTPHSSGLIASRKKKEKTRLAKGMECFPIVAPSLTWTLDRVGANGVDQRPEYTSDSVSCRAKLLKVSTDINSSSPKSDAEIDCKQISGIVNLDSNSTNRIPAQEEVDSSSLQEAEPSLKKVKVNEKMKRKGRKELATDTGLADIVVSNFTQHFDEFGGNEDLVEELCEICDDFSCPSIVLNHDRQAQPDSILLYGPSGSGKRLLAQCMAGYLKMPLVEPNGHITRLVSSMSGDSEKRIRNIFDQAADHAPCVLLLEEIEGVAPSQDLQASSDMVNRMICQLRSSITNLKQKQERILVVAATNKIETVDKRVRDCFTEMKLNMPNERARETILRKLCAKNWAIAVDYDLKTLAMLTPAFVAGDLNKLVRTALRCCRKRLRAFHRKKGENEWDAGSRRTVYETPDHLKGLKVEFTSEEQQLLTVSNEDFMEAMRHVEPAAKREGFATIPTTTWSDVGALGHVRQLVEHRILPWIHNRECAEAYRISPNTGIILYGPPGCGKTMVAKAMANEAGLNFIDVKGPELLNKYVGESEKGLRQIFQKAQICAPCLIFFDEIDALCSNRQDKEGSSVNRQVTTQFLTLLDGCGERKQVFVMGATNILESLDPALLRPGRFDHKIYIGLPSVEGRLDILKALTKDGTHPRLESVDLHLLAQATEGFSGADLNILVKEASNIALWQNNSDITKAYLTGQHFEQAIQNVKPSVLSKDLRKYKSSWTPSLSQPVSASGPPCSI